MLGERLADGTKSHSTWSYIVLVARHLCGSSRLNFVLREMNYKLTEKLTAEFSRWCQTVQSSTGDQYNFSGTDPLAEILVFSLKTWTTACNEPSASSQVIQK